MELMMDVIESLRSKTDEIIEEPAVVNVDSSSEEEEEGKASTDEESEGEEGDHDFEDKAEFEIEDGEASTDEESENSESEAGTDEESEKSKGEEDTEEQKNPTDTKRNGVLQSNNDENINDFEEKADVEMEDGEISEGEIKETEKNPTMLTRKRKKHVGVNEEDGIVNSETPESSMKNLQTSTSEIELDSASKKRKVDSLFYRLFSFVKLPSLFGWVRGSRRG